jgi:hypothetical protein
VYKILFGKTEGKLPSLTTDVHNYVYYVYKTDVENKGCGVVDWI